MSGNSILPEFRGVLRYYNPNRWVRVTLPMLLSCLLPSVDLDSGTTSRCDACETCRTPTFKFRLITALVDLNVNPVSDCLAIPYTRAVRNYWNFRCRNADILVEMACVHVMDMVRGASGVLRSEILTAAYEVPLSMTAAMDNVNIFWLFSESLMPYRNHGDTLLYVRGEVRRIAQLLCKDRSTGYEVTVSLNYLDSLSLHVWLFGTAPVVL